MSHIWSTKIENASFFIPKVLPKFDEKYIARAFNHIGIIERVDFVDNYDPDGKAFNAAYIYFKEIIEDYEFLDIVYALAENGSDKFYHNKRDYWTVMPNTPPRSTFQAKLREMNNDY